MTNTFEGQKNWLGKRRIKMALIEHIIKPVDYY